MIINTNIKPSKNWDFKKLIEFILTNYYNHPEVTINIIENNKICDHYSTDDIEIHAILDKLKMPHSYNLIIREYANLKEIIPHEMVHLHQYEIGDLKLNKFEDKMIFNYKGKDYDSSTPYDERPWEIEAKKLDNKLYKLFKKWIG